MGGSDGGIPGAPMPTNCFNASISSCCDASVCCCSRMNAIISFALVPVIVTKSGALTVTVELMNPSPPEIVAKDVVPSPNSNWRSSSPVTWTVAPSTCTAYCTVAQTTMRFICDQAGQHEKGKVEWHVREANTPQASGLGE